MMNETVEAEQLKLWPLMHGSYSLYGEQLENARKDGLLSGSRTNSCDYDEILGRTEYVFVAPATFRFNYGGAGILIDPLILERRTDIRYSDQDIESAITCTKVWLEGGDCCGNARTRTKAYEDLKRIVEPYVPAISEKQYRVPDRELLLSVVQSAAFLKYYEQYYAIDSATFFSTIEAVARRNECSIFDYFNRKGLWPLSEEILIPNCIEPEYLLGFWDGTWTIWNEPQNTETKQRLTEFLDELRSRTRSGEPPPKFYVN